MPKIGDTRVDPYWGYVWEYTGGKSPYFPNQLWVRQHRLRVANKLKRPLFPTEIVHHKNGIKTENRISNLQIVTRSEHPLLHPRKISAATRKKMSLAARERNQRPAYRRLLSKRAKAQHAAGNLGRVTWSAETKKKNIKKMQQRLQNPEVRAFHTKVLKEHIAAQSSEEMSRRSYQRRIFRKKGRNEKG